MSTLAEIEAAVVALPANEKQELLRFVAERLRIESTPLPELRAFSKEHMADWIAQDEADHSAKSIPAPDFVARAKAIWGDAPAGPQLSEIVSEARGGNS